MAVNQTMKDRHEHNGVVVNENDTGPVSRGATQTPPQPNLPSPSINEALIDRYHPKDPQTRETIYDPIVSRMSVAVGSARLAAERAGKVANAIFANEFQTVAARHRQVKEKTHRMTQPVLAEMDAALASCKREIDMLEEKTSAPSRPQDASGYFLASEVRQRLAGMTDEEREKAIAQALADGDEPALGAILIGSPMLSGITKARHEMLRSAWQKQKYGPEIERLDRLRKALEDTQRAGTLTLSYTLSLCSADIIARAEASERAVQEAMDS